jgi:hypothetical protein
MLGKTDGTILVHKARMPAEYMQRMGYQISNITSLKKQGHSKQLLADGKEPFYLVILRCCCFLHLEQLFALISLDFN